jgi:uncharacterized protein
MDSMTANLTPQYRAAEAKYREAKTIEERRAGLEEMLATIPKHKGTEKLQADVKRRLARLRQELERRQVRKGAHSVHVDPEGAAQVVILGPPNSGKSSLLAALTRAEPAIADYPFTTTRPQPGMMLFEDIQVQLVDLPPVTAQHLEPWMGNVVQTADAALLLADPTSRAVPADVEEVVERMASVHVPLVGELSRATDPHDLPLPTLLVLTKVDRASSSDLEALEGLYSGRYPSVRFSATARIGFQGLKLSLWQLLQLVRVYAKPPGHRAERSEPIVLPLGATVLDFAARIHRELPEKLVYARVWGGKLDGQRVARDFELRDRDLVELAT